MMSPNEIYKKRVDDYTLLAGKLQKKSNRLSMARLISIVGALVIFVSLSSFSVAAAISALVVSLAIFVWFVIRYDKTEKQRVFYSTLAEINNRELKCLDGEFADYRDGSEYVDRDHPYSHDLDIFGHSSLFQYINRTTSMPASELLAGYLKKPASPDEILLRQEAVAELKPLDDWRQRLMVLGYIIADAGNDPQPLMSWLENENHFKNRLLLRIVTLMLSALGILTIILVIKGLPASLLAPVFTINILFYFSLNKKITKLHAKVSRSADLLKAFSSTIEIIEKERFTGKKLSLLKDVFTGEVAASGQIKRLSKLVDRLDNRINMLISVPMNMLFFNDVHYCLAMEKWKNEHSKKIPLWFSSMAEFEALSSLANMAFNNPEWVIPGIEKEFFILRAENMGHPLIPSLRRINNNLVVSGEGKTVLVTGSNMSGKSTFLRTCGVNTVLALAGAPVCATSFTVSHTHVHSSMRISDSLEDNISSFYAELKRLRSIITEAENNPRVFLLLDEILRGTNSNDRFTGSVALIKQLAGYGTVAVVATHDLKLTELSEEMNDRIDNYHFDVKVSGEELFFDYKLTPGICTSLNASILMKKMGIKV